MDDARSIAVPASHQDQIVQLPADARVLGGSEFTPYGIVEYPQRRAMSLQSHPEFTPEYAAALIALRRASKYTPEQAGRPLSRAVPEPYPSRLMPDPLLIALFDAAVRAASGEDLLVASSIVSGDTWRSFGAGEAVEIHLRRSGEPRV